MLDGLFGLEEGLMSLYDGTDYLLDFASFAQDPLTASFPITTSSIASSLSGSPSDWDSLTTSASASSDDEQTSASVVKKAKTSFSAAPTTFHMGSTTVPTSNSSTTLIAPNGALAFPKVLRGDIRRQYARMFTNAMNSADSELISSFIKRYTRPDVSVQKQALQQYRESKFQNGAINSLPCDGVRLAGRDLVSVYWGSIMQLSPDNTVRIEDVQMKTKAGSASTQLCCKYSIRGTLMYDIRVEDVVAKLQAEVDKLHLDADKAPKSNADTTVGVECGGTSGRGGNKKVDLKSIDATKLIADKHGMLPVLPKPMSLEVDGMLTLYIDEQKRIEKFDFVAGRHLIRDPN